ncbi:MAG: hypothetical protein IJM62_03910 [Lachnospiraceae bacterium]|nr:hypothetical protein [Lachnospiraceae bacterium]
MRFHPLTTDSTDKSILDGEYKNGHVIGIIRIGENYLFFKSKLKTYYIAYKDITRFFRRVLLVPAKLCCGRGDLHVESLVICGENETELAQIQVPGDKAAKALIAELKEKMPDVPSVRPGVADAETGQA